MAAEKDTGKTQITIKKLREKVVPFVIRGTAPYVQGKFSATAAAAMKASQESGGQSRSKKKRDPKDFDALYEACMHKSSDGWVGMPASAFRSAMIRACKGAGFVMADAKCSIFVVADGYDAEDGTPLIKIRGTPRKFEAPVKNANGGCDIRVRAMFDTWSATVRVRFDEDQFSAESVAALLYRAGVQVGIGHGRPFSSDSNGCGWGTWELSGGDK